ncbi:endospore germination permease [Clostridium sp. LY3-2]|uniref:endospore germination permease n=1 Tax=Clostridium sp. LY3-2 TaxID=2942482 RepID=UPI0021525607|nr:endospore germination permease [Clostridium sp. LY3-2]MCR6513697.1 endospore germination permease [Clostridium sp. LY3-2]
MNKITTKHLMIIIFAISTISIRTYSSLFINLGGRDTWIAVLLAGVIISLCLFFVLYVSKKTDSFNFKEVLDKTYPKFLSKLLCFLFAIGLFITCIETAAVETSSIHTNIFLETPYWYCLIFFIVPAGYAITKSFRSILSITVLIVIAVFINNILLAIFLYEYVKIDYIMPILGQTVLSDFLITLLFSLGGLSCIFIFLPYLKLLKNDRKILKYSIVTSVLIILISSSSVLSVISTFGPNRASNIFYPEFIQSQRVQLYGFIEFGNLMFLFRTVCNWFIKYLLCATAIIYLYKDKINSKKTFSILFSISVFAISYLVGSKQYRLFYILDFYQLISLVTLLVVPLLTYSIYYFKETRKK